MIYNLSQYLKIWIPVPIVLTTGSPITWVNAGGAANLPRYKLVILKPDSTSFYSGQLDGLTNTPTPPNSGFYASYQGFDGSGTLLNGRKAVQVLIHTSQYAAGEWFASLEGTSSIYGAPTSGMAEWQPFSMEDIYNQATDACNRAGRVEQAVMGNTTWDPVTGTVGMADGESFVLADVAGVFVTDQKLGVRRILSTR